MDSILRIIISTSLVIAVFVGILTLDVYHRNDLILPRSFVGDISIGGMSKINARAKLKERLAQLSQTPIVLAAENTSATAIFEKSPQAFTLNDLGTLFDDNSLIEKLPTAKSVSRFELIAKGISGHRYSLDPAISRTQLEQLIYKKFPAIPPSKNAYVAKSSGAFALAAAEIGLTPNVELLASTLEHNLKFFETPALTVRFSENLPSVQTADLEPYLVQLQNDFPKTINLVFDEQKWAINFRNHPEWIRFERPENAPVSITAAASPLPNVPFVMYWDPISFNKYADETLIGKLDHKPEDVRIFKEGDQIKVEGKGVDGSVVDRDALHVLIAKAMNKAVVIENSQTTGTASGTVVIDATPVVNGVFAQDSPITIPMRTVASKLDIAPELQEMGITELVVDGYTTYDGSPANRQHNIKTGVAKYNGLMIAKDEEFSFDAHIGPVDGEHGFLKELVIKPEGTIPEFGGGLCQVSTTLYRAAIYAGLPIIKRSPHSYAVQYYAQVGGHGLDATVYPPNVDLIIKNDTPGPLIIQAYTEGTAAHFKLYGTKDSRTVNLDGPFISNKQSAPSAPLEVPDKNLKPGQRKQVEKAHGGFDALWYRTIVKDGVETKESIKSRYRAVPNKFLVGGPVVPVVAPTDVNPFE